MLFLNCNFPAKKGDTIRGQDYLEFEREPVFGQGDFSRVHGMRKKNKSHRTRADLQCFGPPRLHKLAWTVYKSPQSKTCSPMFKEVNKNHVVPKCQCLLCCCGGACPSE